VLSAYAQLENGEALAWDSDDNGHPSDSSRTRDGHGTGGARRAGCVMMP
jgi:hypothetical protein